VLRGRIDDNLVTEERFDLVDVLLGQLQFAPTLGAQFAQDRLADHQPLC
jgi:hypothetical protein